MTNFTIPGVLFLVIGSVLFIFQNANHDVCTSGLGVLAVNVCTRDDTIWAAGVVAIVVGGLLLLLGSILRLAPRDPSALHEGWYPDEKGGWRYWDGHRWTAERKSPG